MSDENKPNTANKENNKEYFFDYIDKHINLCTLEERTNILIKIVARIGPSHIQETSDSSNVFLDDLPIKLLKEVKEYIEERNDVNRIDFSDIGISYNDLLKDQKK